MSPALSRALLEAPIEGQLAASSSDQASDWKVSGALRAFYPTRLQLNNSYFKVSYDQESNPITGIEMIASRTVWRSSAMEFHATGGIGYLYKRAILATKSTAGVDVHDSIELQWVPASVGALAQSKPMSSAGISVGLVGNLSIDWLNQTGQLDGSHQTLWMTRLEAGPQISLLRSQKPGQFDGIHFGTRYTTNFDSDQPLRGWMAVVGAQIAL